MGVRGGVWLLLLVVAPASAEAQGWPRDLDGRLWVLEDPSGALTVEEVAEAQLAPLPAGHRSLGRTDSAFWLRASLEPSPEGALVLEHAFPETDEVSVHVRRAGRWITHRTGDRAPFASRPIRHPTFAFPIPSDAERTVFVRLRSTGGVQVSLRWWSAAAFERHRADSQLWLGLFYGVLLALALYNLFLFFLVRSRAYLLYVAFQLSIVGFFVAFEGHGPMYLWPDGPGWAHVAGPTFLSLSYGFSYLFLHEMTEVRTAAPRLARVVAAIGFAYLAMAPLSWLAYEPVVTVLAVAAPPVILFAPVPVILTALRGWTPSRYLLLGMLSMGPGTVALALRANDVVGRSWWTEHGVEVGVALDALFLSFALAERIRVLRAAKERAERAALAERRRAARAQEEERRRIAADLHDGVGQVLQVLVGRLREQPALGALARDSVAELRRVSHALHPHELERLGLAEAVRNAAQRAIEAAGLEPEVVVQDVDAQVPREGWLPIFRVLQEALSNALRHAEASGITVALRREEERVVLRVEDDGGGFDPAEVEEGLGWVSMRERARLIDATLTIEASVGGGTRVRLALHASSPTDRVDSEAG